MYYKLWQLLQIRAIIKNWGITCCPNFLWNKWQNTRILFRFIKAYSTLWNKWYELFCKNSKRLNTGNYFCKKFYFRCFTGFWISLRLSFLNASECFFYYFFHFESIKFRSSRSRMSFKINIFKSFARFKGKHLCWSLFVIKLAACKPANVLIRYSSTGVFLLILLIF